MILEAQRNEEFIQVPFPGGVILSITHPSSTEGQFARTNLAIWSKSGPIAEANFVINSLPSPTHVLKKSIKAKIVFKNGEYLASFSEAEIVTSGDTAEEAIQWLKQTIITLFDLYSQERNALGPLPKRQLKVLEMYVGKEQTVAP